MFHQNDVPPILWPRARAINTEERILREEIRNIHSTCQHKWKKITWRDPNYSARVDLADLGTHDVIVGFQCTSCNAHKPFEGFPHIVCFKCGGTMKSDHIENCDGIRIHVHKCEACGHEHDTT